MKLPKKNSKPESIINNINNITSNNITNIINKEKENNKNLIKIGFNMENNEKEKEVKISGKARSNSQFNSKIIQNYNNNNNEDLLNLKSSKNLKDLTNKKIFSDLETSNTNQKNKKMVLSDVKTEKEKNKENDLMRFSMNLNELKKNKLRGTKKETRISDFNISPTKDKKEKEKKNEFNLENELEEITSDKNTKNNEYADILYKYCEEDSSKFIKKYFGELRGKDILFFTSKLKNELCTIWNISKCIIIPLDKISISRYTYFPIKFINYNKSFCLIYFEDIEKRNIFLKKCEENTSYIKIEDLFEFKEKIGQGHFGLVKRCIEKNTGKEYAVKIMDKNKIKGQDYQFLIQERNYMVLIKHPHIVSLIQDYEDENCLYFVMEYFKGGDLSKYMKKIKSNPKEKSLERIGAKIIKIIAQGVEYLNQFGIVHRDLKPENIVFGTEDDIKSIKIIDLGVAITLPFGKQSSDPIGTLAYISPEMFSRAPYSYKVDVWSIGVLLYWLTSGGALPFDDDKNDEHMMGKKVVYMHQEYPEKYFGDKSKSLINLIDKALEKNPEKRINIHDFLAEEWLNKYNK
jgi:tRNA A-37 threonylcarbamoyl transferase component Bud32